MAFVGTGARGDVCWLVTAHQHLLPVGVFDVEVWEAGQVLLSAQGGRIS